MPPSDATPQPSNPPPTPAGSARDAFDAKARADLGWAKLVDKLAERTHTQRGMAAARALEPTLDLHWIRRRLTELSEARTLHDRGEPMAFGAIYDVEEHLVRAEKGGHLEGNALREVAATLSSGRRLRRHLLAHATPHAGPRADSHGGSPVTSSSDREETRGLTPRLGGRAALIAELPDVTGPIEDSFDDMGHLLDNASPALGPLRRKAAALRDELDKRVHALLDHPLIAPHLQDRFYTRREDRFVVPIRTDARTRVKGIVHGTSGSGQTVFVEPEEVVDLNNRLKLAELEVSDEERRILGELTLLVADAVTPIRANLEILSELDLIDAGARLSSDMRGTEPIIIDDISVGEAGHAARPEIRLDLRRARHPLMVLSGRTCIPNDLILVRGQTLIVSGPNAGGKTVALKTAGLLSLMARAGLHLPVQEGSSLPLFATILTDVGDDQSIERNLSTFSAHVLNLNHFLDESSPSTLLLLDEIAVGTDPEQGAALAQSVLERFADRGATVIVTTHYERLKTLAAHDSRFVNASVGFDMDKLEPTYELHLGVPGASGAIVVARRLGLPDDISTRAESLLGAGTQHIEELLGVVERERRRLGEAMQLAEEERAAAEEARIRAEGLAEEAEIRVKAARKAEHDEAVESLRKARVELDRTRSLLRKVVETPTKESLDAAAKTIDASARELQKHAPSREAQAAQAGRPARTEELTAGTEVYVTRMGGRGVVVAPPKDGRVAVQVGALKLNVEEKELLIPTGKKKAVETGPRRSIAEMERKAEEVSKKGPRTVGNTLDLRGERVDAALALAEKFLDEALRGSQDVVFFVHGHGSGALRAALREHLAGFPGVEAVRKGDDSEGGDGVTVVTMG